MVHGEGQVLGQSLQGRGGVPLVGGHAAQIVAAHLGAPLHDHLEIALVPVVAADQVGDGLAVGDGAVTVAELPVVEALEAGMGVVVRDGEGVDEAVRRLDGVAQEIVKAVLVDAFAGDGAAETAKAPAVEGELPDVDHPALAGQGGAEVGDHPGQVFIVVGAVGHDDHIPVPGLGRGGQHGTVYRGVPAGCPGRRRHKRPVGTGEDQLIEEHPGFLLGRGR